MRRKVIKTGHSLAVTIPDQVVDNWEVKAGEEVLVDFDNKKQQVVYIFTNRPKQMGLFNGLKKERKKKNKK